MVNGRVYVNSQAQEVWPGVQTTYNVVTDGSRINLKLLKTRTESFRTLFRRVASGISQMPLTAAMLEQIKACANVSSVEEQVDVYPPDYPDSYLMLSHLRKISDGREIITDLSGFLRQVRQ